MREFGKKLVMVMLVGAMLLGSGNYSKAAINGLNVSTSGNMIYITVNAVDEEEFQVDVSYPGATGTLVSKSGVGWSGVHSNYGTIAWMNCEGSTHTASIALSGTGTINVNVTLSPSGMSRNVSVNLGGEKPVQPKVEEKPVEQTKPTEAPKVEEPVKKEEKTTPTQPKVVETQTPKAEEKKDNNKKKAVLDVSDLEAELRKENQKKRDEYERKMKIYNEEMKKYEESQKKNAASQKAADSSSATVKVNKDDKKQNTTTTARTNNSARNNVVKSSNPIVRATTRFFGQPKKQNTVRNVGNNTTQSTNGTSNVVNTEETQEKAHDDEAVLESTETKETKDGVTVQINNYTTNPKEVEGKNVNLTAMTPWAISALSVFLLLKKKRDNEENEDEVDNIENKTTK